MPYLNVDCPKGAQYFPQISYDCASLSMHSMVEED